MALGELLDQGVSGVEARKELERRCTREPDALYGALIPTERTIQRIAAEHAKLATETDADDVRVASPGEVRIWLDVLRDVIEWSGGRVRAFPAGLTFEICRMKGAYPDLPNVECYRLARAETAQRRESASWSDAATHYLAFEPWRSSTNAARYLHLVREGRLSGPVLINDVVREMWTIAPDDRWVSLPQNVSDIGKEIEAGLSSRNEGIHGE